MNIEYALWSCDDYQALLSISLIKPASKCSNQTPIMDPILPICRLCSVLRDKPKIILFGSCVHNRIVHNSTKMHKDVHSAPSALALSALNHIWALKENVGLGPMLGDLVSFNNLNRLGLVSSSQGRNEHVSCSDVIITGLVQCCWDWHRLDTFSSYLLLWRGYLRHIKT